MSQTPNPKSCVICNNPIGIDLSGWDGGHNAQPVTDGQCCEPCNADLVIPARLRQAGYSQAQVDNFPPELFREE